MQHNENSKPNRFQHFLREKGYYIVLALCICAVGVSGWLFLSGALAEKDALSEPALSVATQTEIPKTEAAKPASGDVGRHGDGDPVPAGENAHTAVCKQACRRH